MKPDGLASFLCWTFKPYFTQLGGIEITTSEYLRHLALSRIYLDNIPRIRTSVLTQNERALEGLLYGADDFDLPIEDEVTQRPAPPSASTSTRCSTSPAPSASPPPTATSPAAAGPSRTAHWPG
jgi:2-iminoacetate synthase ThiH